MPLTQATARTAFRAACILGRPVGGIRPRRIYHILARAGFKRPDPKWVTTGLGFQMKLCPFYFIDREILAFGAYDQALHSALERLVRPGMTCFDVGANIGDSALHMARLCGPSGKVHAFEPAPSVCERLREHVTANEFQDRIAVHQVALSDYEGTASFCFASPVIENQGMGSLVEQDTAATSLRTEVKVQTLDAFINIYGIESIGLIKIDIQGGETTFFRGAAAAICRFRPPLLLEVGSRELAKIGSNSILFLKMVESLGYRVHLLTRDGRPAAQIRSQDVDPDFDASNVLCLAE